MKRIIPCFLSLLLLSKIHAQTFANYSSARNTGITYSSISGTGNSVPSWRNTTSNTLDDNRSNFIDIGFDFWYGGTRYTQFCVSTNGYIDFSSSSANGGPVATAFGYDNTSFTNSNMAYYTQLAIAALYDDLCSPSAATSLGTVVKYALTGSAPGRTLTVEWINMQFSGNSTPSLNFQVQLVESTGQILINYGSMSAGTQVFSYCTGLNAASISPAPTAAQLKELQSANSNSFGNTVQNNISSLPASNSQYVFTPVAPTAPSGTLSFSGVSTTSMNVNWTNWALNEIGYVIYKSTDGINYSFVTQTAANAITAAVTGLSPSTTYYWKVYAVTEGCLSAAVSGNQATSNAGSKTSTGSGNWNSATTWSPNGVPTVGDNVTIANGHIVQINATAQCNNLVIGGGTSGVVEYNNGGAAYSFTVNGNITINSGAQFLIPTNSNATSSITVKGSVVNSGTFNLASDANSLVKAYFINNGNITVSGTGATTFNTIYMDLGSTSVNTLEISCPSFTAPIGFLTLQNGVFKLSSTNAATIVPVTTSLSINKSSGFILNAPSTKCTFSAGIDLAGQLAVSGGTLNVGDAANEDLQSIGGNVTVSGGALNVAGKFYTTSNNICKLSVSSGSMSLATVGSTNTSTAPFQMTCAGSAFTMSGGQITICREGGTGAQDLGYINTVGGTVTGGTLQLGNAATPAGSTMQVNTNSGAGDFIIGTSNVTGKLVTNSLSVVNNITLSGSLFSNSLNISVGGNWTNNGVTFTPGTNKVIFNGAGTQTIYKSGGENFYQIDFSNSGLKTFSCAITASSNVIINSVSSVDVGAANNQFTIKGNFTNNGNFNARTGLVLFNGTAAQSIGGSATTSFYDMTLNNTSGGSFTGPVNLIGTMNLNNGALSSAGQLTMVSTATATARIAQITGSGDITGNVTVQRFAPGGSTGWALFGTCISSGLTFADWNDDFAISCPNCPDGFPNNFYSIYSYDETATGSYSNPVSYVPIQNITDPIVAGKGYWVYFGNGQYTTSNITMDVTGTLRKFNYTIPLNYSNYGSPSDDGWNLVYNPYPSPISWSALKGVTSGIDNAVYAYNADLNAGTGMHATYINGVSSPAVGSGGIGDVIPIGQGFYVHSTGATALNATEGIKVSGNPTFLRTTQNPGPSSLVRIYLDGPYTFHDETVIYQQPGATSNFDASYDALKMAGQDPYAPYISIYNPNGDMQVNGVGPIVGTFSMELKTLTGYPDTYTISAENFSTFPTGACLNLYDKFTQSSHDLKSSLYVFNLSDTTTVARFVLNITVNPLQINSNIVQPNCQQPFGGQITAVGVNSGPWNYYWKDPSGNTVKTTLNKAGMDTLNGINAGTYTVEINTVGQCDNNTSSFSINNVVKPVSQFSCVDTVYNVYINGQVTFTNNSVNTVSQNWNFGDNIGSSNAYSPVYNYTGPGTFIVRLVSTSSSGCIDTVQKAILVMDQSAVGLKSNAGGTNLIVKSLGNNNYSLVQNLSSIKRVSWELRDALGRELQQQSSKETQQIKIDLDLDAYAPGVYYLKLYMDDKAAVIKLPVR
jgi:hypothetical protein